MTAGHERRMPTVRASTTVQRLAVLLTSGLSPASAWNHAAGASNSPVVRTTAECVRAGLNVPEALLRAVGEHGHDTNRGRGGARRTKSEADDTGWRSVAAAWMVADRAGAPLAPALGAVAEALRDLERLEAERETQLAGPTATTRLVTALPPIGLVFGAALGFDTIGVLIGNPLGWLCLLIGGVLLILGRAWSRHLLRGATPPPTTPGLALDLTAIAVGGGGALDAAVETVARALRDCLGGDIEAEGDRIRVLVTLSQGAGVPIGTLLREEARQCRLEARDRGERHATRLGVTLMLPLALCVLPAFMALGVAPLMIAVVTSSLGW